MVTAYTIIKAQWCVIKPLYFNNSCPLLKSIHRPLQVTWWASWQWVGSAELRWAIHKADPVGAEHTRLVNNTRCEPQFYFHSKCEFVVCIDNSPPRMYQAGYYRLQNNNNITIVNIMIIGIILDYLIVTL